MGIPEDVIQKIKEQNDIVDIISESVKIKKSGRNYFGLCPFHHEDSPSFSVSQDKQIYKCFGCGEAGNVITFVMKTKNFSFIEALKYLADKSHIQIEPDSEENRAKKDNREKLYRLNVEAAKFFYGNLNQDKKIKDYFLKRGIMEGTIRKFGLGYSLDSWDSLISILKRKGFTELDLLSAGLIVQNQNGSYYDRFRNRIIFPVFDYQGKVIGFGGRVLDDSKPKYLNSPETILFNKGNNLYALNFAIKGLNERTLIVVEGYMDCIALHQAGIKNCVASLGTALTLNQAKLMRRYADKIIIAYDSDIAGQTATLRGLDILKGEGFDIRVLILPEGKDPDEFIRKNGKDSFLKLINEAMPLIEYRLFRASEGIDFKDEEMVIKYGNIINEILIDLNPVERDVYIKKVSEQTGIREQSLFDFLKDEKDKNVKILQEVNISENIGQKLYKEPPYLRDERYLLKLMHSNEEAYKYINKKIYSDIFISDTHKSLFDLIVKNIDLKLDEREKLIEVSCIDEDSIKEWVLISEIQLLLGEDSNMETIVQDYIKDLKKYKLEESKKNIMKKIKELEKKGLIEESLAFVEEYSKIQNQIREL